MLRWWCVCLSITVWWTLCSGEGNVGCLFSETVCEGQFEWCFDDFAFGRCLPLFGAVRQGDLHRYDLDSRDLHELEQEMERLFTLGYRWGHAYTQCVLQTLLYALRLDAEYDVSVCNEQVDQDLEGALRAIEGDEQKVNPWDLAYVRFLPSASDPHAAFADEVYFPPIPMDQLYGEDNPEPTYEGGTQSYEDLQLQNNYYPSYGDYDVETPIYKKTPEKKESSLNDDDIHIFRRNYNTPDTFRQGSEYQNRKYDDGTNWDVSPEDLRKLAMLLYEMEDQESLSKSSVEEGQKEELRHQLTDESSASEGAFGEKPANPMYTEGGLVVIPKITSEEDKISGNNVPVLDDEVTGEQTIRIPEADLHGQQLKYLRSNGNLGYDYDTDYLSLQNDKPYNMGKGGEELAAEYGNPLDYEGLSDLDWGFKRRERLDVKKPGPWYNINNYAFDYSNEENGKEEGEGKEGVVRQQMKKAALNQLMQSLARREIDDSAADTNPTLAFKAGPSEFEQDGTFSAADMKEGQDDVDIGLQDDSERSAGQKEVLPDKGQKEVEYFAPSQKKEVVPENNNVGKPLKQVRIYESPTGEPSQYDVVDTTYAYLGVKDKLKTWKEGRDVTKLLAELLHLRPETFSNIRVAENQVTFKVLPNPLLLNASEVAIRAESPNVRDEIKKTMGIEIISTGIGDKNKVSTVLYAKTNKELFILTFVLCGLVAAILIAAAALYVVRRHARSREKLQNLTQPDTEASKDYQELCRARMASKSQEKPEPIHVASSGKIASLSRESEGSNNSPSSRSSTSSWSEEPVITNMDISTGHMVLSYMEDHLKNKDRLEQEWIALCAYEAEPCATNIASQPANIKKNRYNDVLPYDHSRVVLNDLSNISGADFINASTIMDHDPRNPAYITTQGPLPHTAADFWQMIWEQGSVVIVMLTRLTENGNAMCHRYWPEEGSEVYHIYEVHLVSEHIWCDDYLVRSFYLKNLKTGETRTVTQFHFLSWSDSGVPLSTKALLEFRRKVNKSYRGRSCPIVIHCSDGVGRSGTYVLIDMVLNRMAKGAKEIDIAATLEHIRDQRPGMVKNKLQFEFVLMAVAEEVHAILKALPQ